MRKKDIVLSTFIFLRFPIFIILFLCPVQLVPPKPSSPPVNMAWSDAVFPTPKPCTPSPNGVMVTLQAVVVTSG
ncbi:hypothetical protein RRG08_023981 [Elysia crispata]|uniref:Uncharacterized protein n=1 Tax=Elysia crispata TaxID=231223 RepID=A0AAE0YMH0_9GAST|nr:hypothetical protein RRG08_023981 [Elysia crispata]